MTIVTATAMCRLHVRSGRSYEGVCIIIRFQQPCPETFLSVLSKKYKISFVITHSAVVTRTKMAEKRQRVLSIQSHVVSGYVGNKSATFPLQVNN